MNGFFSALQFITILPLGKNRPYDAVGMIPCFPLVGLMLGGLLAGFDHLFLVLWTPDTAAMLDVLVLIILTGAFHLDGLGDTADGLFSHRSRERALEIMKDSRVGAMGLIAIVCGLALKWAGLAHLGVSGWERMVLLVAVPSLARSSLLFGIRFLPYGREQGTGKDHFKEKLSSRSFRWVSIPLVLTVLTGWKGLFMVMVFGLTVFSLLGFYRRKMGCITGDMLGAMVEVTESVLFLFASALWGMPL